jgi:hypothetical protein
MSVPCMTFFQTLLEFRGKINDFRSWFIRYNTYRNLKQCTNESYKLLPYEILRHDNLVWSFIWEIDWEERHSVCKVHFLLWHILKVDRSRIEWENVVSTAPVWRSYYIFSFNLQTTTGFKHWKNVWLLDKIILFCPSQCSLKLIYFLFKFLFR